MRAPEEFVGHSSCDGAGVDTVIVTFHVRPWHRKEKANLLGRGDKTRKHTEFVVL